MTYESEQAIRHELASGETLLWTGQPRTGLQLRAADALIIPFSLLWAGFAVFWELSVFRSGAPLFFRLWGVPFVLLGLYMVIGRFFVDAWQRARTCYGLTNQRVVIVTSLFGRRTRSVPLVTAGALVLQERPDRSGTITFGPVPSPSAQMAGNGWPRRRRQWPPSFDLVENARDVYDRIRGAQQASIGPASSGLDHLQRE